MIYMRIDGNKKYKTRSKLLNPNKMSIIFTLAKSGNLTLNLLLNNSHHNPNQTEKLQLRHFQRYSNEIIQLLIHQHFIDVNSCENQADNQTILMSIAELQKWDLFKLFISHGAQVQTVDVGLWTPLHYAAYCGGPNDVIDALIEAGADPKAIDAEGKTPDKLARNNGYFSTAYYLDQIILPPIKSAGFIA
jgi:ankyrin repeat protein